MFKPFVSGFLRIYLFFAGKIELFELERRYVSRSPKRGREIWQTFRNPSQQIKDYTMKRLIATFTLASTFSLPVFAQEIDDTAGSAAEASMQFRAEPADDELAMGIEGNDFVIGAGAGGAGGAGALQLSLTDEQLEKIAKLKGDMKDAAGAKKAQLQSLRRQLKDALMSEKTDKSAVMDIQSKINSLHSDLANARVSGRLEVLSVLTPEQKQKLRHAALKRQALGAAGMHGKGQHGGRGGHHKGHGRPGRPGGNCSIPQASESAAPENAQSGSVEGPAV